MTGPQVLEIDGPKLKRMITLHVAFLLIDIRSPEEYARSHIKTAINLPADIEKISKAIPAKDTPVVLYDGDGVGSRLLVEACEKKGFLNIVNLTGGFGAYRD